MGARVVGWPPELKGKLSRTVHLRWDMTEGGEAY